MIFVRFLIVARFFITEFSDYAGAVYSFMMRLPDDAKKSYEIIAKWWNEEAFIATRQLIAESDNKKLAPVKAAKDERSKFQQEQDAKLAEMTERKRKQKEDAEEEKESRKKLASASEKMCEATSKIADFLTSPAFATADIQMNNPNAAAVPNATVNQLNARIDSIEVNVNLMSGNMNSMSGKLDQIFEYMQQRNA